jgi:DNA replication factor GINS
MLTYETLRRIFTEERATNKLVRLPENFFKDVKEYLDKKSKLQSKEDKWELESARGTLEDLLEIRERKILTLAMYSARSGIIPENLMPEEKNFFDNIVQTIKEFQKQRKRNLEEEPEKMIAVAILEDIPEFVGTDLKNYGPFKKGDIATIPEENAKLFIQKNMAKEINIKE